MCAISCFYVQKKLKSNFLFSLPDAHNKYRYFFCNHENQSFAFTAAAHSSKVHGSVERKFFTYETHKLNFTLLVYKEENHFCRFSRHKKKEIRLRIVVTRSEKSFSCCRNEKEVEKELIESNLTLYDCVQKLKRTILLMKKENKAKRVQ